MRRQKRDKSNRAYTRGYHSGLTGRSRDLCPYTDITTRQFWLAGWRDGRADNWAGFSGASTAHRLANMG